MSSIAETLWKDLTQLHVSSYRLLKERLIGWHTIPVVRLTPSNT